MLCSKCYGKCLYLYYYKSIKYTLHYTTTAKQEKYIHVQFVWQRLSRTQDYFKDTTLSQMASSVVTPKRQ